jgi:hypothetical protein
MTGDRDREKMLIRRYEYIDLWEWNEGAPERDRYHVAAGMKETGRISETWRDSQTRMAAQKGRIRRGKRGGKEMNRPTIVRIGGRSDQRKNTGAKTLHAWVLSRMLVTLETKSTVVPQTNVGCWTPNSYEIRSTGKADFENINISRLGP